MIKPDSLFFFPGEIFLWSLVFFIFSSALFSGDFQASNEWFSMGNYYLNFKKDEKKALQAFKNSLKADSDNIQAAEMVNKLTAILEQREPLPAVKINDKSKQWYHNGLYLWNTKKDALAASECLERALQINPYNAKAAALLTKIKEENNIDSEKNAGPKIKIKDKKGIIEKKTNAETAYKYVIASTWNYKKAEYPKALENIERALKISPGLKQALDFKKKIEQALETQEKMRIKDAVKNFSQPGENKTYKSLNRAEHWYWLGKYYFDVKKDFPQALECFERAGLLEPDNDMIKAMINRSKLKLYFVSDASAVKIVDTRSNEEKNIIKPSVNKDPMSGDSSTKGSLSKAPAFVENSEKTGSSQALTQDFNKNDPEYKRLLKEEEVILVSDYDLEPHEVDKAIKAGSDEKKAEKDAAAAMPQLSHYEKWKKRRLEFSSLTSTLFNDFWKDSEVTGIINKTEELKDPESRKKNIESELEAIWDMINKREEKLKNQDDQEKKRFLAEQIKKEKNANLAGDSVIMNSISGLDLDRLMTPEQIRQEKQSEKDDFFKSQKKQMDPKVVLAVKEELKKADNLLKNKRREEALEVCRNAFNMVLEIDESNVEALYNLLLLYEKTGSYDFATLIFFKILTLIDSIKADTELNRMIRAKIMCNVKTIIIQSSVAAYNRMVSDKSNQMGPGILSLKELKKKGFLVTGSKPYELQLNLFDKTVKVDISINDFECHGRGGYAIDSNGYVRCSVHGISSYILMHSTKKHLDF